MIDGTRLVLVSCKQPEHTSWISLRVIRPEKVANVTREVQSVQASWTFAGKAGDVKTPKVDKEGQFTHESCNEVVDKVDG